MPQQPPQADDGSLTLPRWAVIIGSLCVPAGFAAYVQIQVQLSSMEIRLGQYEGQVQQYIQLKNDLSIVQTRMEYVQNTVSEIRDTLRENKQQR